MPTEEEYGSTEILAGDEDEEEIGVVPEAGGSRLVMKDGRDAFGKLRLLAAHAWRALGGLHGRVSLSA